MELMLKYLDGTATHEESLAVLETLEKSNHQRFFANVVATGLNKVMKKNR